MKDQPLTQDTMEKVIASLAELDLEDVVIEGKRLKPSQCYYFESDPLHLLFNINCPDKLKVKVQDIISKYLTSNENRAQ